MTRTDITAGEIRKGLERQFSWALGITATTEQIVKARKEAYRRLKVKKRRLK